MHYHFKIHKEKTGYWAECVELPGCQTQGATREKLIHNMREALNLYLDEPVNSKTIFSLPNKKFLGKALLAIPVEPHIAFAFYLRQIRLSHQMTQKEVAEKMGFKNLYSYQRLESSKTANPEFATLLQIKKVFPEFEVDELLSVG